MRRDKNPHQETESHRDRDGLQSGKQIAFGLGVDLEDTVAMPPGAHGHAIRSCTTFIGEGLAYFCASFSPPVMLRTMSPVFSPR